MASDWEISVKDLLYAHFQRLERELTLAFSSICENLSPEKFHHPLPTRQPSQTVPKEPQTAARRPLHPTQAPRVFDWLNTDACSRTSDLKPLHIVLACGASAQGGTQQVWPRSDRTAGGKVPNRLPAGGSYSEVRVSLPMTGLSRTSWFLPPHTLTECDLSNVPKYFYAGIQSASCIGDPADLQLMSARSGTTQKERLGEGEASTKLNLYKMTLAFLSWRLGLCTLTSTSQPLQQSSQRERWTVSLLLNTNYYEKS